MSFVKPYHLTAAPEEIGWVVTCIGVDDRARTDVRIPSQIVTNMLASFCRLISSFTWVRMLAGEESLLARDLISVFVMAMKSAEGTPLPDTSPIPKHNWSSLIKKKS